MRREYFGEQFGSVLLESRAKFPAYVTSGSCLRVIGDRGVGRCVCNWGCDQLRIAMMCVYSVKVAVMLAGFE